MNWARAVGIGALLILAGVLLGVLLSELLVVLTGH